MKKFISFLLAAMLVACGKPEPTATTSRTEAVESLAANPERLKELRQQCKTDRAKLGDELCNRVAEATNRRFLGDGKTPYTPPKDSPKF
ncbi:TPA: EexN family lipoprotein [Pseudomonas aeruginosa]|nr:EexN family lipoprotein [Pseudomonas aeruginosa]